MTAVDTATATMESRRLIKLVFFTIAIAVLQMAMAVPDGAMMSPTNDPEIPGPGPRSLVVPINHINGSTDGFPRWYVADFEFGSPAQNRTLSISTSYDLTMTFTRPRSGYAPPATPNAPNPPYSFENSTTAVKMSCNGTRGCEAIQSIGPGIGYCGTDKICRYHYPLSDGVSETVARGFVAKEGVSAYGSSGFYGLIGCTVAAEGRLLNAFSDGMLSVSRSPNSFFLGVVAKYQYPRILSYCLSPEYDAGGNVNCSGVLVLGSPREEVLNGPIMYTPLLNNTPTMLKSRFLVMSSGWSIEGKVQNETLPLSVDPAIETSFLPQASFGKLVTLINDAVGMVNDSSFTAGIGATCYTKPSNTCDSSVFPELTFLFGDSTNQSANGSDYTFTTTVPASNGTRCAICLGIFGWPYELIFMGANLIQRTWVVQDLESLSVGFMKGECH